MKKFLIILTVFIVFLGCAGLGFLLSSGIKLPGTSEVPAQPLSTASGGDQHYLVLIQIDSLESTQPELVSVWFLSFYETEVHPPTLTFTQVYPSLSHEDRDRSMASAFALDSRHDPVDAFWQTLRPFQIGWEGYILLDGSGLEGLYAWLRDTPGLDPVARDLLANQGQDPLRMRAACEAAALLPVQQDRDFDWDTLFPAHIRTNLRVEMAVAYWDRAMNVDRPLRCEVFQAP